MQTKKTIIILTILLLISSCKGFRKEEKYTPTITSKDIYTGKQGLIMEFFENAPPPKIFEDSILPIGIRLYNRGAYNIKDGHLSIMLEKDYMELNDASLKSINEKVKFTDEHIQFDLKGKTIEHPKGEQDIITFTADTKELSLDPQSEYHNALISITSCYKYQTKAVETLCIDTDIYGLKKREKPCAVKTVSLNSQGAPVAVTKIESEMLPSKDNPSIIKPRFVITVKNLGDGEVIKKDRQTIEGACSAEPIGYKEWNIVNVKAYLSTMEEENKLDCANGILNLKKKEDTIRCSYEQGFDEKKGAFSAPLYIILDYGYTNTISREVKIKKK